MLTDEPLHERQLLNGLANGRQQPSAYRTIKHETLLPELTAGTKYKSRFNPFSSFTRDPTFYGSKFRYIIFLLLMLTSILNTYSENVIYTTSIKMVAGDILLDANTKINAIEINADPLTLTTNAAAQGTCPVEIERHTPIKGQNATLISKLAKSVAKTKKLLLEIQVEKQLREGSIVNWTISQRGMIFTAPIIGRIVFSLPSSWLGLIAGNKVVFLAGLFGALFRGFLFPLIAGQTPFWFTFLFQLVVSGINQSLNCVVYPLAAAWFLPSELNIFIISYTSLGFLAASFGNKLTTQILASGFHWSFAFHLPSFIISILTLLWWLLGSSTPEHSRFVSDMELDILQYSAANSSEAKQMELRSLGHPDCTCSHIDKLTCPATKILRTPNWIKILTCPTIWSLLIVQFAFHWSIGLTGMTSTYYANILHLQPEALGNLSLLDGIFLTILTIILTLITRKLSPVRPFNISLTMYRRLTQFLSLVVMATGVATIVIFDCHTWAQVINSFMNQLHLCLNINSIHMMPTDLSPEDSGIINSLIKSVAVGDVLSLPISSQILSYAENSSAGSRNTWRAVWLTSLSVKIVGVAVFVLFSKSEPKSFSNLTPSGPCQSDRPNQVIKENPFLDANREGEKH